MSTLLTFDSKIPESVRTLMHRYGEDIVRAIASGKQNDWPQYVVVINLQSHLVTAVPTATVQEALKTFPDTALVSKICESSPPGVTRVVVFNEEDHTLATVRIEYTEFANPGLFTSFSKIVGQA